MSTEWNKIMAGLQAGCYDAAANLDLILQRAVAVQFSKPVYTYQGVFVIKVDVPYNLADAQMSYELTRAYKAVNYAPIDQLGHIKKKWRGDRRCIRYSTIVTIRS